MTAFKQLIIKAKLDRVQNLVWKNKQFRTMQQLRRINNRAHELNKKLKFD